MMSKNNEIKNLQYGKRQQQQGPTSQKPPGVSPKQVPSLGVLLSQLLIKKNDYRSFFNITFISDIALHMVAISICNEDNG